MIKIQSSRFGELEIDENEIINFPCGIPGIPFEKFILRDLIEPVKWLIAVDDPDVAMLVVPPFKFFPTYGFELSDEISSILEAEKEEDIEVYVALLKYNDGVAANLKSPFIINKNKKIGVQILLEDEKYSFKEPIKKMKVWKAKTKFDLSFNGYEFKIKPGDKYLFADDVFNLLPEQVKSAFEQAHSFLPPFYKGENLNGKTLLVIAQAAIGDALCMTPALREIKKKYPNMTLNVTISGRAKPVLEGLPYIDNLLPMPVPFKEVSRADYIVKVVEMVNTPQFDNLSLIDYYLWKLYIYRAERETPDVLIDEKVLAEMKERFDKIREVSGGKKVLLFHYLASSVHRTIPPRLLKEIEDLIWDEYVPVICSLPEEDITVETALDVYGIRAANLSVFMNDIRYLIASVALSDAVITADTATLHIAAGLDKPTVLVSGPIDAELRASNYPTVIAVTPNYTGQTCVSPCKIHATTEPCIEAQVKRQFYSPCIESIPPKVIYLALKDAELLTQKEFETPEKCIVCEFNGNIPLFEVINGARIFECPSCGLQFTYPMKVMDYDRAYRKEHEDLLSFTNIPCESFLQVEDEPIEIEKWSRLPRFNVLIPILQHLPKGNLLDVGCSTEFFSPHCKENGI